MRGRKETLASSPRPEGGLFERPVPAPWQHGTPVLEENRTSLNRSRDSPRGASLSAHVRDWRRREVAEQERLQKLGRAAILARKREEERRAREAAEARRAALRGASEYDVLDDPSLDEDRAAGEVQVHAGTGERAGEAAKRRGEARREASRAAELGMMLPQFRESQGRALRLLNATRDLLEQHPEIRAMRRRERLAALHRRIDAEDFSRGARARMRQAKRDNIALMTELKMAEKNVYG